MNVLQYAAQEQAIFEQMASENGYSRKTTFFSDLSIAECYGKKGIEDTYNNVLKEWKSNLEFFTEFVLALNWKSWEHYSRGNAEFSQLYSELFYKAQDALYDTFKDKESTDYIFNVLD